MALPGHSAHQADTGPTLLSPERWGPGGEDGEQSRAVGES